MSLATSNSENEKKLPKKSRRKFLRESTILASAFTIVPGCVLGRHGISPSDKINLGIIGLGKQGNILASLFIDNSQAQIVAGSEVWKSKREWFTSEVNRKYALKRGVQDYKGVKTYLDYREMLERSDIDGIIIATPDH